MKKHLFIAVAVLGIITLASCEKNLFDKFNPNGEKDVVIQEEDWVDPNSKCKLSVAYDGPHFCSGQQFITKGGKLLRVFELPTNHRGELPLEIGQKVSMSIKDFELEFDCLASVPSDKYAKPVIATCYDFEVETDPNDDPDPLPGNCDTWVTYNGTHFCSGLKLLLDDGTQLRALGIPCSSDGTYPYEIGERMKISYEEHELEVDCTVILPPEEEGIPVLVSCYETQEND